MLLLNMNVLTRHFSLDLSGVKDGQNRRPETSHLQSYRFDFMMQLSVHISELHLEVHL